jgi:NAD+ synthase
MRIGLHTISPASRARQLAEYLGVPKAISERPPTTDTYSMPQSQEEFYFSLPYEQMDLSLYAFRHGIATDQAARGLGLSVDQMERVYADIRAKQAVAEYLHSAPLTIADILD